MKAIRYALEALGLYILYGLFWLLPLDWASWLGGKLGEFIGPFTKGHKVAAENIKTVFTDINEEERKSIIKKMWNHFGRVIAEYPHLKKIAKTRTTIRNAEVLENVLGTQNAIIFATGHIGNWEINAAYLMINHNKPVHITYRALNNPINDKLLYNARTMNGKIPAYPKHKKSGFDLVRAIKDKQLIGFMIDQKFNEGLAIPFFGRPAMTNPVFVQLAQRHDAKIIMTRTIRTKGANFEATAYPQLATHNEDGTPLPLEDVLQNAHILLEEWIIENPDQWLWMHRRWDSKRLLNDTQKHQPDKKVNHGTL